MFFQRPFQIFLEALINGIPGLDLIFGMLHEILKRDTLLILLLDGLLSNFDKFPTLNLLLYLRVLESALELIRSVIVQDQKLWHFLGIQENSLTNVRFEVPAINPPHRDFFGLVTFSLPEDVDVMPLVVNELVGLVELHAPLGLAKRMEEVEEPSGVVQNCGVLLWYDVCDEGVPVDPA